MTLRITAGLLLLAAVAVQPGLATACCMDNPALRICAALSGKADTDNNGRSERMAQRQLQQLLPLLDLLLDGPDYPACFGPPCPAPPCPVAIRQRLQTELQFLTPQHFDPGNSARAP